MHRSPEFSLQRYAPWALALARRATGRTAPEVAQAVKADATPAGAAAPAPAKSATTSAAAPEAANSLATTTKAVVNDVWLRTYRTVSLSVLGDDGGEAIAWKPDVIHANDGNTLAPAWWIAQRTGANVIYDAHELWRHRNVRQDRPLAPLVESAIEAFVIGSANGVITVSPSIATWLQDTYDLPELPTLVRNIPRRTKGKAKAAAANVPQLRGVPVCRRVTRSLRTAGASPLREASKKPCGRWRFAGACAVCAVGLWRSGLPRRVTRTGHRAGSHRPRPLRGCRRAA
ncbi:glycosyltransferase [Ornithinimicrobium sp. INDO-MA30-4]|uniref:glycosyltransferase n=1 Tax=Ornithinimicrobium sp. INDO-MA30-4 TaxID=2908651 RepID=UPI001F1E4605|nr:glycosyltransferase family 4 protein [Ornithinimicrobium sp. INDO-MA30-4]UJH71218.1 glycosyltransferase family 4 protein [Ornithinimicrobium sp. INDO-MA30-4]